MIDQPLPKKSEVEETLQFLKREEVRTMAKDIAKLREQQAKEERERIVSLREIPQSETKTELQPPPPPLMPHGQERKLVFAKSKTRFEKIVVRLVVAGVLVFILSNGIAFSYWYFMKKRPTPPTKVEETIIQLIEPEGSSEPERPPAPAALLFFDVPQEKTIKLGATDNLLLLLSGSLKEEYPQGFTRILIQKTETTAFLTTREFLNRTAVAMPEPLLSLLKEDFMLFVYSSPGRKRLGFIAELSQTEAPSSPSGQGVQDMLKSWETTLEQDTKTLWEIVGQKGSAYTLFFRQGFYQNNLVRFQTFSVIDFGIVYTIFGTKLILATSFESVTKAVDQIIQSR